MKHHSEDPLADLLDRILYWTACALLTFYTVAVTAGIAGFVFARWFA